MLGHGPLGATALGQLPTLAAARGASLSQAPLGAYALGQLPSTAAVALGAALDLDLVLVPGAASGGQAGDAVAPGALLDLTLSLVPGAASAEGQLPPIVIGGFAPLPSRDALARGADFDLVVLLRPGRALGDRHIDAAAGGAALPLVTVRIAGGTATGDATGYDNEFVLLLAA